MSEPAAPSEGAPRHVAIIMDGNGRWASLRGRPRMEGHRAGLEAVRDIVRAAGEMGIAHLTLFAFSSENWDRPRQEVDFLMGLLEYYLEEELEEAQQNDVRVRAIGQLDRLPESTRRAVDRAVAETRDNRGLDLIFAISYGGRAEIVDAARRLARDAELGHVDPDQIDEKTFGSYLYAPDVPDPDLLIRTGGESRVSNFLLWQIAYTEIHTTDLMWPDFRRDHLAAAIADFRSRERRFGLTSDQLAGSGGAAREAGGDEPG